MENLLVSNVNMSHSKIEIRPAIKNDIEEISNLHCLSFSSEDHIPVLFGKRYIRATYRWQILNKRAYTLVATVENKIVGVVAVCNTSFTFPMFIACLPELTISLILNPSLLINHKLWSRLLRRSRNSNKENHIVKPNRFAQMTIGFVASDYRGKGIFPRLVEATKVYSLNRGSIGIRAGVYKTNSSSRNVFIKGGWEIYPEMETTDTVYYIVYLNKL
jgi:GNAT superfamily N-acetyltransferase